MAEREIFDSWKEISDYLKRDARTCQRYEREYGLPVHRLDGSPKARVFAYRDELDAWREKKLHADGGLFARAKAFVRGRPIAVIVFTLLVVSGLVLTLHFTARPGPASDRPLLAVLPFGHETGREGPKAWEESLHLFLIQSLSKSKYFNVASDDLITGVLRASNIDPDRGFSTADLEEIARKALATHVVSGKLVRAGDGFVIILAVKKGRSEEFFPSRFECKDESALVKAIDLMALRIKMDLGLTRSEATRDFDATGMEVSTNSFEAFRLYNEGRRLHIAGDFPGSIHLMNQALRLDPEFALAWRSIWASRNTLGDSAGAKEAIERAVAMSVKASDKEQFWIKSDYFDSRAEFGKGIETCQQWAARYPDDKQALQVMGRMCIQSHDPKSARKALDLDLEKGDINPYAFYWSIAARRMLDRLDEADRLYDRAMSIHPKNRLIIQAGMENALARGALDQALAEARRHGLPESEAALAGTIGDILLLKGDFAGARKQYERLAPEARMRNLFALDLAEGKYAEALEMARRADKPHLLSYIALRQGRLDEALREAGRELRRAEASGNQIARIIAIQFRGLVEISQGDIEQARRSVMELRQSMDHGLEKWRNRHERFLTALIDSAEGRPKAAKESFEAALSLFPSEAYARSWLYKDLFLFYAAQGFEKAGEADTAEALYLQLLALLRNRCGFPDLTALSHFAVGRIAEARGDEASARRSYQRFLEVWKDADPGIPEVEDARKRLAALEAR